MDGFHAICPAELKSYIGNVYDLAKSESHADERSLSRHITGVNIHWNWVRILLVKIDRFRRDVIEMIIGSDTSSC